MKRIKEIIRQMKDCIPSLRSTVAFRKLIEELDELFKEVK